jgi:threonine/homoserine/homoserine lactone efflux protein
LLATSANAFNAVKWLGAAYLMWIGMRMLWATTQSGGLAWDRCPVVSTQGVSDQTPRLRWVFLKAFATNVLNPKVALFFLAFVPQFIPAQTSDPAWTFVVLGCLFNFNGLLICIGWALAANWLSQRSRGLQHGLQHLDRVAGCLFVGFGLKLALTEAPAD